MTPLDYIIVVSFLLAMALAGLWISRLIKDSDDFFVAGRSLSAPLLFTTIDFEVDVEGRRGRMRVPGYVEMTGEPIRNKVTNEEARAQICLPNGFEYLVADIGSASSRTTGPVQVDLNDSYGQFANLHLGSQGVVRA